MIAEACYADICTDRKTGWVTLSGVDAGNAERIFACPNSGGPVLEQFGSCWRQVYKNLRHAGSTLYCPNPAGLTDVIRQEHQGTVPEYS